MSAVVAHFWTAGGPVFQQMLHLPDRFRLLLMAQQAIEVIDEPTSPAALDSMKLCLSANAASS